MEGGPLIPAADITDRVTLGAGPTVFTVQSIEWVNHDLRGIEAHLYLQPDIVEAEWPWVIIEGRTPDRPPMKELARLTTTIQFEGGKEHHVALLSVGYDLRRYGPEPVLGDRITIPDVDPLVYVATVKLRVSRRSDVPPTRVRVERRGWRWVVVLDQLTPRGTEQYATWFCRKEYTRKEVEEWVRKQPEYKLLKPRPTRQPKIVVPYEDPPWFHPEDDALLDKVNDDIAREAREGERP